MLGLTPRRQQTTVATALATLCVAGLANAAIIGDAVVIHAQSGVNIDIYVIAQGLLTESPAASGIFVYNSGGPVTLPNTGTVISALNLRYAPQTSGPFNDIGINYTFLTGANTTTFTISSGEYFFGGSPAQSARGNDSLNITNGNSNFAADAAVTYAGLHQGGGGGFLTQVDGGFGAGPAYAPLGTLFQVFGPVALTSASSTSGSDFVLLTPLGTTRTSMSSQWRFSLTGGDQIGAVSTFRTSMVIPAPGAAALLAFGGMVAIRRRR